MAYSYSAKKARAGKDIGKPGKNFSKIARKAGGGEKGNRIAGSILKKLRKKRGRGQMVWKNSLSFPLFKEVR